MHTRKHTLPATPPTQHPTCNTLPATPLQIEELPDGYYVCVGLTALLLPCMLALLSLWAPGAKPRGPRPKQKAK